MKKLILSLVIGAVLIGVGAGVLFAEIAEFSRVDYLPYIENKKTETITFNDKDIFADYPDGTKEIDIYLGEFFDEKGECIVKEDKTVEGVEVEIHYRGEKPNYGFYHTWTNEDGSYSSYHLFCSMNDFMPKDVMEAAEYIFKNKVIAEDMNNFIVEKVVIKTSRPHLIRTSY